MSPDKLRGVCSAQSLSVSCHRHVSAVAKLDAITPILTDSLLCRMDGSESCVAGAQTLGRLSSKTLEGKFVRDSTHQN